MRCSPLNRALGDMRGKMKKAFILVLCPILSHLSVANDDLGFPLHKKYDTYSVSGDTVSELEASFNLSKPAFLKELDAYTKWEYWFSTDDNTCEIHEFSLNITYTLPQLERSVSSAESTELFREHIEQLYRHEQTHCALAVMVVHQMYLEFQSGQDGNCNSANHKVRELEDRLLKDNELFDAYTFHGGIELVTSPFGEESYLELCEIPFSAVSTRI